jgi:hypothetical protein
MKKNIYHSIKALLLLCFLGASAGIARAQALVAGDIAFTGYNSNDGGGNNPNQVSFVILKTGGIVSGTQIHLTDNGYSTASSALATNEGDITISINTALPQFTEVYVKVAAAGTAIDACTYKNGAGVFVSTNISASVTGNFILSQAGDQVIAFQGTLAAPTVYISGVHMNNETTGAGSQPASSAATWDVIAAANGPTGWIMSQNRSAIPPGLTNGTNAVMLVLTPGVASAEKDNAAFTCANAIGSSAADLRTKINTVTNWGLQDVTPYAVPTACTYMVSAPPAITGQPANATVCAGGSTTFQVTASAAVSYQWQLSTGGAYADITNNATYANATTATLTVNNITAGMNGYSYKCVVTGNVLPVATSNAATLTVSSPGTWLGTGNGLWSNTANWSCGVLPTATTNVTIGSGAANMPTVDITTAVCNNLTIASGATLSFNSTTNVLDIKGSLTNNGTFNPSAGKVIFSGTVQGIPAATYKDLQVNGGSDKTLGGAVTVSGVLTLTNGFLVLGNNNLNITATGSISGGSAVAFIVTNGTGTLTQNNIGSGGRTGTVVFPVGSAQSSFTRAALSNSGTADNFSVKVIQGVFSSYTGFTGSGALTQDNVNKTWFISEATAGGSNATLTLEWNGADQLTGFNGANCQISHFNGTNWVATGTPGNASGLDPYTISRAGITTFSPFGVSSSAALPLELLSFEGRQVNKDAVLSWKTISEKKIATYQIERSADSRNFKYAGEVAAQLPGNNNIHNYTWTDEDVFANGATWYYRLKIVHEDGTPVYAPVIRIQAGKAEEGLIVYPNPLRGNILNVLAGNNAMTSADLVVTDIMGREQIRRTGLSIEKNIPLQLNTATLKPGLYWIRIFDKMTGTTSALRFAKQ